ncbi:MAG: hypothetical protein HUJ25_05835 [Crocinitomicaceae bacterium]|nr:hypothetical protein [Crocinitomicaceae bacterium]
MKTNRIAIIDLGTNTFNLLIVDKKDNGFDKVYSTKIGVGLGLGGINNRTIAPDAMERGLDAVEQFLKKCHELEVSRIKAFGTSAIRDAQNKTEFLSKLKRQFDLETEVITGNREAQLIYEGVKIGYPFEQPTLIMDIGGGSTEFIYADKSDVIKSASFDIGTARIYQSFKLSDPYSLDDVQEVIAYLEERTHNFFDDIKTDILIGASGSFETFYAILNKADYPENEFEDLDTQKLWKILDDMIHSTFEERMANPYIIPIRKKMAPIAAIKIKWILEKLDIKTLTISPYAMKEGVIELI